MTCRFCGGIPHEDVLDGWPMPDAWQNCVRSHRRRIEELERRMEAMPEEVLRHYARLPFEPSAASRTQKTTPASPAGEWETWRDEQGWLRARRKDRGPTPPFSEADRPVNGQETQKTGIVAESRLEPRTGGVLTKAMEYEIAVKEGTLAVPGSEEDR